MTDTNELDPKALEGDFMALAAHLAKANAGRAVINRDSDGATFVHRDVAIEAMQALIEAIAARNRRATPADVSGLVERLLEIANNDWRVSFLAHTSDTAKEAADALTRLSLPNAGSGWKAVPVEPIAEMLMRGWDARHPENTVAGLRNSYMAMLGASPPLPARGAVGQPSPARGVEAVRVKALEWGNNHPYPAEPWSKKMLRQFIAKHELGRYSGSCCVFEREDGRWAWTTSWEHSGPKEIGGVCDNPDEAKAAAQADYEQRIKSSLEPAPARADAGSAVPATSTIKDIARVQAMKYRVEGKKALAQSIEDALALPKAPSK